MREYIEGPYEYDQNSIKYFNTFRKWLIELGEQEGQHMRNKYWSLLNRWKSPIDYIDEDDFENFIIESADACADYVWRTHKMPPGFLHWYICRKGGDVAKYYLQEVNKAFRQKKVNGGD